MWCVVGRADVTVAFDTGVLAPDPERRRSLLGWLIAGLEAVDPMRLTADALADRRRRPAQVIAIGKAAPGMARGAASALAVVGGICVTDHPDAVPQEMRLMLGDHPVPAEASFAAGAAVLDMVAHGPPGIDLVALVSGGGSALCEAPREGVPADFLSDVTGRLLSSGAGIEEMNLVRSHLSSVKAGGIARAAGHAIETFVISDVGEAGPEVVASGPTIPGRLDPAAALAVLKRFSIDVPGSVTKAIQEPIADMPPPRVTVLADGRDAARAVAEAAAATGPARLAPGWLQGDVGTCLEGFLATAGPGVTVAAGEATVKVGGDGVGGRDTHAALLAAHRLGPGDLFCAFATDGVDGSSGGSGAIVDGSTIIRGGDSSEALRSFDSARYLAATSDLLRCPPTGTNVADLWIMLRRP
jgi:hydroxypyruvate reductase